MERKRRVDGSFVFIIHLVSHRTGSLGPGDAVDITRLLFQSPVRL